MDERMMLKSADDQCLRDRGRTRYIRENTVVSKINREGGEKNAKINVGAKQYGVQQKRSNG